MNNYSRANLRRARPGEGRTGAASVGARITMFARLWTGAIGSTLELCRAEGHPICRDTAAAYLRDPRFKQALHERNAETPGAGVLGADDLKRWLTRVVVGVERDDGVGLKRRSRSAALAKNKSPSAAPRTFLSGSDRLKAADLLGRSLGAFVGRAEVLSGDLRVSVTDLLDDDLKHAKPVHDVSAQVVDKIAQVVDKRCEENVAALLE